MNRWSMAGVLDRVFEQLQILRAEDSGHLFRLIFEQVDCDRRDLSQRLDSIVAD